MNGARQTVALTGRSQALDPRIDAFRPDLADVALAERLFASHFAAPIALICAHPFTPILTSPGGEQSSELLAGEVFAVLDLAGDWAWGWSDHDHYVGYVRRAALHPGPPASESKHGRKAIDAARAFLNMPYLWGGRGGAGIDCSGLVQRSLASIGVACPRDSDQQMAHLGHTIATDRARPGDLIFFQGHVGFLIEGDALLHATRHHGRVVEEPLTDVVSRMAARHGHGIVAAKRVDV